MKGKLPVAIIWHMHQPYYRHPQTSEFVLPWVRLHASKDYLHMARLLQEFPRVKANFTMVPSLRDQLEDYARGADDEDTRVTMRTVDGDLTAEEKQHMLRRFFSIHHGNVIHRHEEYRRLLVDLLLPKPIFPLTFRLMLRQLFAAHYPEPATPGAYIS